MKLDFPLGQWTGIAVCDGFVDPKFCHHIDHLVDEHGHELWEAGVLNEGQSMGGVDPAVKNSSDMQISQGSMGDKFYELGWYEDEVQAGIGKALNYYVNQYEAWLVTLSHWRTPVFSSSATTKATGST